MPCAAAQRDREERQIDRPAGDAEHAQPPEPPHREGQMEIDEHGRRRQTEQAPHEGRGVFAPQQHDRERERPRDGVVRHAPCGDRNSDEASPAARHHAVAVASSDDGARGAEREVADQQAVVERRQVGGETQSEQGEQGRRDLHPDADRCGRLRLASCAVVRVRRAHAMARLRPPAHHQIRAKPIPPRWTRLFTQAVSSKASDEASDTTKRSRIHASGTRRRP